MSADEAPAQQAIWNPVFQQALDFHGHLCLDIAMGYRVTLAALEAMQQADISTERLVATVANDTCAVDAVQSLSGCTYGKRNLVPDLSGKPVYRWQDERTGNGVRVYVHYWETFDVQADFRATQSAFKRGELSEPDALAFQVRHDALLDHILTAPAELLFKIAPLSADPPPKSGSFESLACDGCGEHTKQSMLVNGHCNECNA